MPKAKSEARAEILHPPWGPARKRRPAVRPGAGKQRTETEDRLPTSLGRAELRRAITDSVIDISSFVFALMILKFSTWLVRVGAPSFAQGYGGQGRPKQDADG